MRGRLCVPARFSSNGDGLPPQKRKTSAGTHVGYESLCVTQSADSPVRPFGAEPVAPAFAVGVSPDAPGAAPARTVMAFAAISLLCTAVPSAASQCLDARHRPRACHAASGQVLATAPVKKVAAPKRVGSSGGGGLGGWPRITGNLMP